MRYIKNLLQAAAVAVLLSACAGQMPPHSASAGNVQQLRGSDMSPVSVGAFKLAAGKPESMDTSITSRASSMTPPQGSISAYLRDALIAELKAAGKFDASAPVAISGELTESELNTNMGTADGALGARFIVTEGDAAKYDQDHRVSASWESSFVGAIAIPKAYQEYFALYQKLFAKLFADPTFAKATKPKH